MPTIDQITGLQLYTFEEARSYYENITKADDSAPPFSSDILKYLKFIPNKRRGETFLHLVARVDAENDALARADDVFRAIWPSDPDENQRRFYSFDRDEQERLDAALAKAASYWSPEVEDATVGDVYAQLATLAPHWARVPTQHDPNTADFLWSRARCVFASAGYTNHARICEILHRQYPLCALTADETREQWSDALLQAHKNSGWPAQTGQLQWRDITSALVPVARPGDIDGGYDFTDWHVVVAYLHILKHLRIDEDGGIVVTYRGLAHKTAISDTTNALTQKAVLGDLTNALGVPAITGKTSSPMAYAVKHALSKITTNGLLRRRPLSHLPGLVLTGPWSTLRPDPQAMDGFVQHGMRLDGVWLAGDERIEPVSGESADVVSFAWNVSDADDSKHLANRRRLERILPDRFEPGFASDLFFAAFPNIDLGQEIDRDAMHAIFDAPIVASLVRGDVPGLAFEFPLIAFLPKTPSLDESTNSGKTLAALTYARILSPSIMSTSFGSDSSSAPDIRASADIIRRHGTAAIDEFAPPKAKNHIFSRDSLQTLCTGGSLSAGLVMENAGELSLQHSLVVAAKALDFGPDLANRTLPFYLDALTDEHRANAEMLEAIQSGQVALIARLQMLATILKAGLTTALEATAKVSTSAGLRFGVHRAIARILYAMRTGREDDGQVDAAIGLGKMRFTQHQHEADENGIFSSLDEGKHLKLRMSSFFAELTMSELEQMSAVLRMRADKDVKGMILSTTSALIEARMNIAAMSSRPYSELLPYITGSRMKCGNRQVTNALLREIRTSIGHGEYYKLPGLAGTAGWVLYRHDTGNQTLISLHRADPSVTVGL